MTIFIDGDAYEFDPKTGEYVETHHGHDADAVRAFVDELPQRWRTA